MSLPPVDVEEFSSWSADKRRRRVESGGSWADQARAEVEKASVPEPSPEPTPTPTPEPEPPAAPPPPTIEATPSPFDEMRAQVVKAKIDAQQQEPPDAVQGADVPAAPQAVVGQPPASGGSSSPSPSPRPTTVQLTQGYEAGRSTPVAEGLRRVHADALAAGLDDEGARAATAVALTEGGMGGAVGDKDRGKGSGGTFQQFFGPKGFEGEGNALAREWGVSEEEALDILRRDPHAANDRALRGYLGNAIRAGQEKGLTGPALAEYAQRFGQRSESPERAAHNYEEAARLLDGAEGPEQTTRPGGPRLDANQIPNQFGTDQQLTPGEAAAACGPALAVWFASTNGRQPTLREAVDIARQHGWNEAGGMNGLQNESDLLTEMGVKHHIEQGVDEDKLIRDVQSGNAAGISTGFHYFGADAYDPATGRFHVGVSGTVVRGGSEWMSLGEMDRISRERTGTGINGTIYVDDPGTPTPSPAVSAQSERPPSEFERPSAYQGDQSIGPTDTSPAQVQTAIDDARHGHLPTIQQAALDLVGGIMAALGVPGQVGRLGIPSPAQSPAERVEEVNRQAAAGQPLRATQPNTMSPGQRLMTQGLEEGNKPFEETLQKGAQIDPTGGYLAGAAGTVAHLGTDPLTTVGGSVPRIAKVGTVAGGVAGAGYSALTGADPVQTAANIETGANVGMVGAPLAEGAARLAAAGARRIAPIAADVARRAAGPTDAPLFAHAGQMSQETPAPTFFSQLRRTVEEKMQNRALPDQAAATLRNNGVKPDEMVWTGVDDFLDEARQSKRAVTKQELLDHLDQNEVQVTETVKGGPEGEARSNLLDERSLAAERYDNAMDDLMDENYLAAQLVRQNYPVERILASPEVQSGSDGNLEGLRRSIENALREKARISEIEAQIKDTPGSTTRYENYTTPGGENYRELLVTLPESRSARESQAEFDDVLRRAREATGTTGTSRPGLIQVQRTGDRQLAEDFDRVVVRGQTKSPYTDYVSGHWDEPNILAHIRFNDRVDAEGKRVLFVEEVQSDWHQAGRKQGYQEGGQKNGVPDAPFKKTWPELAMKRVIRWAAENDYDRVAWTTGEQQASRYNLANEVDALAYDPRYGTLIAERDGNQVFRRDVPVAELPDTVGQEVARRLLLTQVSAGRLGYPVHYLPLDRTEVIGGEGMKGFYDKILPEVANKLAKKFGSRVATTEIPAAPNIRSGWTIDSGPRGTGPYFARGPQGESVRFQTWQSAEDYRQAQIAKVTNPTTTVHALDITPQMRETAVTQGFPLFARAPGAGSVSSGRELAEQGVSAAAGAAVSQTGTDENTTWQERATRAVIGAEAGLRGRLSLRGRSPLEPLIGRAPGIVPPKIGSAARSALLTGDKALMLPPEPQRAATSDLGEAAGGAGIVPSAFRGPSAGVGEQAASAAAGAVAAQAGTDEDTGPQERVLRAVLGAEAGLRVRNLLRGVHPEAGIVAPGAGGGQSRRQPRVVGELGSVERRAGLEARMRQATGTPAQQRALRMEEEGHFGNLKADAFTTSTVRRLVADAVDDTQGAAGQRRGVVKDAQVMATAALNLGERNIDDFLKTKPGKAFNAEEATELGLAIERHARRYNGMIKDFDEAKRAGTNTPQMEEALAQKAMELALLSAVRSGAAAEAGRALRSFQQVLMAPIMGAQSTAGGIPYTFKERDRIIKQALDNFGGTGTPFAEWSNNFYRLEQRVVQGQLTAEQAARARHNLLRQVVKSSAWEKMDAWRYASMLSSWKTHLNNFTGNIQEGLARPVDLAMSGQFKAAGKDLWAMGQAIPNAFHMAVESFQEGSTLANAANATKLESVRARPFGDSKVGRIFSAPLDALAASDEFFRAVNYAGALHSEAWKMARGDATKYGTLLANPTEELVDAAAQGARKAIFAEDPGALVSALTRARYGSPAGRIAIGFVLPFVRTPANIYKRGIAMSLRAIDPTFGLAENTVRDVYRGYQETGSIRQALKSPVNTGELRMDAGRSLLAKLAVGSFAYYAAQGLISGDGPSDQTRRAAMMEGGWQPHSVKIGDRWFDYTNAGPLAVPLSLVANAWEAYQEGQKPRHEVANDISRRLGRTLIDTSYLRGISDLIKGFESGGAVGALGNLAAGTAGSFIPFSSAAAAVERVVQPEQTTRDNIFQTIGGRIPGVSSAIEPQPGIFGEPRAAGRETDLLGHVAQVLSPLRTSREATDDPVVKEVARLAASGQDAGVRTFGSLHDGARQLPVQQRAIQKASGQAAHTYIAETITNPAYQALSDERKAATLKKVVDVAYGIADLKLGESIARDPHNAALLAWNSVPHFDGMKKGSVDEIREQNFRIAKARAKLQEYRAAYGDKGEERLEKESKAEYKLATYYPPIDSDLRKAKEKRVDDAFGGALLQLDKKALVGAGTTVRR